MLQRSSVWPLEALPAGMLMKVPARLLCIEILCTTRFSVRYIPTGRKYCIWADGAIPHRSGTIRGLQPSPVLYIEDSCSAVDRPQERHATTKSLLCLLVKDT